MLFSYSKSFSPSDTSSESSSSDSESSSSSSSSSSSESDSSSSSSESSSSGSDSDSSSSDSSSSSSEKPAKEEPPVKKRRLSLETPVKAKAGNVTSAAPQTAPAAMKTNGSSHVPKRGEAANRPNVPFCRIRPEDVVYADDRLKDNRYMSKGGVENDFGYKAHMDLIVTRGKGFTKEKNKKKRGSYSGGKITMQSHSIKFD
ncbi:jun-like transcription factor [Coemansia sp. RSA 1286]|nr:jun-like transcription factor [Coemansia sp. RSA 1286]